MTALIHEGAGAEHSGAGGSEKPVISSTSHAIEQTPKAVSKPLAGNLIGGGNNAAYAETRIGMMT